MPPFVSRKRKLSPTPPSPSQPDEKPNAPQAKKSPKTNGPKTTAKPRAIVPSSSSASSSSLSDADSSDFEDVHPPKRQKIEKPQDDSDESDEDEEEVDWEDAVANEPSALGPEPTGELNITLSKAKRYGLTSDPLKEKRGPSKRERAIRHHTHCMHVQFLLFHNLTRNGWICDKEVQKILVQGLPPGVKKEHEKWKAAVKALTQGPPAKGRKIGAKRSANSDQRQRDWGPKAERLEKGTAKGIPDLARGDPLVRFLKLLGPWWKKRFSITAPGLRKQGYKSLEDLEDQRKEYDENPNDAEQHGERVENLTAFRRLAKDYCGSRDVGAQLYVALLRGLGLEARLVCNLQPLGYGWSKKAEEAEASVGTKRHSNKVSAAPLDPGGLSGDGDDSADEGMNQKSKGKQPASKQVTKKAAKGKRARGSGTKETPLDLDSDLEDNDDDDRMSLDEDDSRPRISPARVYDKDLLYPHYWAEVLSPTSNKFIPVDPLVTSTVASMPENLASFEPKGAKADKAKQIMAYVVAFSADGCAKDVTVRYLRKQILPGKTKGFRMPPEKHPVYNTRGKVARYEDRDWFKSVMASYRRPHSKRTLADDIEDGTDLKPAEIKASTKPSEESLQSYKNSDTYILERHLRREEALRPEAKHVKTFMAGKGDNVQPEKVFLRSDVLSCKTSESWHKEGREVTTGEQPLKLVPVRAVTLNRKREIEQYEAEGGKMMQGLYCREQTNWIIPPPIVDGVIPRNAYGNMDCFVPSMVPKGAVHLPYKGLVKLCKKLEIDFAEAVIGFEFGNRRAVPVVQGVIVAEGNESQLMEAWEEAEEMRQKKENEKKAKEYLTMWRKFLIGLRIVERVRDEYGADAEGEGRDEINPFTNRKLKARAEEAQDDSISTPQALNGNGDRIMQQGGFLPDNEDEHNEGGGFVVEHEEPPTSLLGPRSKTIPSALIETDGDHFESDDASSSDDPKSTLTNRTKEPRLSSAQASMPTPQSLDKAEEPPRKKRGRPKGSRKSRAKTLEERKEELDESDGKSVSPYFDQISAPASGKRKSGAGRSVKAERRNAEAESKSKPTSTRPRRQAARKSEEALKSHYFGQEGSADDSDDL